jgi:hypothetical protein
VTIQSIFSSYRICKPEKKKALSVLATIVHQKPPEPPKANSRQRFGSTCSQCAQGSKMVKVD